MEAQKVEQQSFDHTDSPAPCVHSDDESLGVTIRLKKEAERTSEPLHAASVLENSDQASGILADPEAEEHSLIDESSDAIFDLTGPLGYVHPVDQWSDCGVIAALNAPVRKKVFADGQFEIHGDSNGPIRVPTTSKYTVVLCQEVPLVLVNDQDAVDAVAESMAHHGIRTYRSASIWASILWPVLVAETIRIDGEEVIALLKVLSSVCTKACERLASANTSKIRFHMSVLGCMIRMSSEKCQLYLIGANKHQLEPFSGRLIKLIVDVDRPSLKFVIEYFENGRSIYTVLTPPDLRDVNDHGIYFYDESCVPAGRILKLPGH